MGSRGEHHKPRWSLVRLGRVVSYIVEVHPGYWSGRHIKGRYGISAKDLRTCASLLERAAGSRW